MAPARGGATGEQIRQIAERIKRLREIAGPSLETLARELDLPVATLRDYESGGADIPLSFLAKAAHRFQVQLSSFITGEEPRLRVYQLTRAGRGVRADRHNDCGYQSLAFNFAGKRMDPFAITAPPCPATCCSSTPPIPTR